MAGRRVATASTTLVAAAGGISFLHREFRQTVPTFRDWRAKEWPSGQDSQFSRLGRCV